MEERPPEPPTRPILETAGPPADEAEVPPYEPLIEQPAAVEPVLQAPAGGAISAAEREEWCRRAAQACTEGRLTLGAYSDLVEILQETEGRTDFEGAAEEVRAAGSRAAIALPASGPPMVAILSSHDRKGSYQLSRDNQAATFMGGINLDLREATVSGPETVIRGFACMAGVNVRVPPGIRVETGCIPIMGGCEVRLKGRPARQDAPTIRLELVLVMAAVNVRDTGGMKDLVEQRAALTAAGFSDARLRLNQSRMDARAAARQARHEAQRAARHAAREARRDRHS